MGRVPQEDGAARAQGLSGVAGADAPLFVTKQRGRSAVVTRPRYTERGPHIGYSSRVRSLACFEKTGYGS